MSRRIGLVVPAVIAGAVVVTSLFLLHRARAALHDRDEQFSRLKAHASRLEEDVARLSFGDSPGLTAADRELYLSLDYREFDATPGSGHRQFRDRPQNPAAAGMLIEAYLERHGDLPAEKRLILEFHAAQLFAMGGMNERAIAHLDRVRVINPKDRATADATEAFLLQDRAGLLAVRRRMAEGEAAKAIDFLIERLGESYGDVARWTDVSSTVRMPKDASPAHRAAADRLAKGLGLAVKTRDESPTDDEVPAEGIWLEIRSLGSTPDRQGYVILHANASTIITATDPQRLDAAVKRFMESSREYRGRRQAPCGLSTSFDLAR